MLRELTGNTGALVSGRRLFDIADGWGDNHPVGAPVVVVTHRAPEDAAKRWPRTTFVDGVDAAITEARKIAGDQDVTIASTKITQQALDLGLVDCDIQSDVKPRPASADRGWYRADNHGHSQALAALAPRTLPA
jgi:dihydrofolate reductase